MNRRGFLGTILALGIAPAIVKAESIMRLPFRARPFRIISGELGQFNGLVIYSGAMGSFDSVPLARIQLPNNNLPAFNGTINLGGGSAPVERTGMASWFRLVDPSAQEILTGTVGEQYGDMRFNSCMLMPGQVLNVTNLRVSCVTH